eukprot:GEMP01022602.1.p2 GENE.GEMP01022602.1~~GEMP01022602.1.p2  ORF type:complete len:205 (+),score=44.41 GEMP01022602.1:599-1213(+)
MKKRSLEKEEQEQEKQRVAEEQEEKRKHEEATLKENLEEQRQQEAEQKQMRRKTVSCSEKDCTNVSVGARPDSFCKRHGGGGRCNVAECKSAGKRTILEKDAYGPPGWRCSRHNGARLCVVPRCVNKMLSRVKVGDQWGNANENRCARHGGGRRCEVEGCGRFGNMRSADSCYCKMHFKMAWGILSPSAHTRTWVMCLTPMGPI